MPIVPANYRHLYLCKLASNMPFLFFFHHFPIDQSLAFFVKFDSESYHLSPVSLERLHIATIDNLANGGFLATIVSQFQFYHIDIARSSCYNIYPARESICSTSTFKPMALKIVLMIRR